MFIILCLVFVIGSVEANTEQLSASNDEYRELRKALTEKSVDGNQAHSLLGIIREQGNIIKALENKVNAVLDQSSIVKSLRHC